MKNILLAFLLLFSSFLFSQNWALFQPSQTYNFNPSDVIGVRVDSVNTISNSTTFHFNRILNDTVHQNFNVATYPITDITQPNIFGENAVVSNDSITIKNQFGDFVYLKPNSNLNQTWNLIVTNQFRIEATVDSLYSDSINGSVDSLKRISFQYFDSANVAVSNGVNSKQIIISKSNGIIKSFNLYQTPVSTLSLNYQIDFNRLFKNINLTNLQLFDKQVNDEVHFQIRNYKPNTPPPSTDYVNHKVVTRTVSSAGDTIKFQINRNSETNSTTIDFSTNPPTHNTITNRTQSTFEEIITSPNSFYSNYAGKEPRIEIDSFYYPLKATIHKYNNILPIYNNNTYNNRLTIAEDEIIASFDSSQNSWILDPYAQMNPRNHILEGITKVSLFHNSSGGGGGFPSCREILYYKKGMETWGRPNLITSINDIQINENLITIYPNPTKSILTLKHDKLSEIENIEILNLNGQIIFIPNMLENIDVSSLQVGIYYLRLTTKDGVLISKFIKE